MKKRVEVEIELYGDGAIEETAPGSFTGGVPEPHREGLSFMVHHKRPDERPAPFVGNLQINVTGTSEGYRELGRYFLELAELDATADPGFHDHHDALVSEDRQAQLRLILHKPPGRAG